MTSDLPHGFRPFRLLPLVGLALLSHPSFGQPVSRLGTVQQLNVADTDSDYDARLVCGLGGPFVATWMAESSTPGWFQQVARTFDFVGSPSSAELPYGPADPSVEYGGNLARDAAGNFLGAWYDQSGGGPGTAEVYVSPFTAAGVAGTPIPVNSYSPGNQINADIASDAAGNFVVVWEGLGPGGIAGTWYRRFDLNGTPIGVEALLEAGATSGPRIAMNPHTGAFVATWARHDGTDLDVRARRFDAAGTPQGSILDVNTSTVGDQRFPFVAIDGDGDFVVVFRGEGQGDPDGILGQLFDAAGAPVGGEFWVNATINGIQYAPLAAFDEAGGFLAVWTHTQVDGHLRAYAARFSANGVRAGTSDYPVTATLAATDTQVASGICRDDARSFRVIYDERDGSSSASEIFSQRLALGLFVDAFEIGSRAAWSGWSP